MLSCKHILRMKTYSINVHPVIALMFSQTGTDVLPRRDEGSDKPSATIEPHRIMMVQTRTRTQAVGLKVHYTIAAHYTTDTIQIQIPRLDELSIWDKIIISIVIYLLGLNFLRIVF